MSGDMKTNPVATSGSDPSGREGIASDDKGARLFAGERSARRFDRKRNTRGLKPIHRNLSHRCGKCLIDLDAGSDRWKGSVRDGAGTNDIAFPNRRDPATG